MTISTGVDERRFRQAPMSGRPRKTRMPPGYQRQMLVMAISGLSFIVVLALIGLLLHFVG